MLGGMKKTQLNGKMCDVVSLQEYASNKDGYITGATAIEVGDYALPIIGKFDTAPGIYVGSAFSHFNLPDDTESQYNLSNVIDMSNVSNIGELMEKQEAVRDLEREVLTNPDGITTPVIEENDSPAMKALKQAVLDKHIDINKYEPRFGSNFNNDKRTLDKSKISIQMLERMCKNLDIKASLVLEDTSPNVPNPIGHEISVELTGDMGEE